MSLQTFEIKVQDIYHDPNNARKHDSKNLAAIKGSLVKFGQQKPIVIDKKNIVLAGNGTLEAAKELGWEHITVVRSTLEGYEAMAYALADNRSSELAEWDQEQLGSQLVQLQEIDYDIADIGFPSTDEWDSDLRAPVDGIEENDAPLKSIIKVYCEQPNKDEAEQAIKEALAHLDGVTVET